MKLLSIDYWVGQSDYKPKRFRPVDSLSGLHARIVPEAQQIEQHLERKRQQLTNQLGAK
jgi:hypothetical protein